MRNQLSPNPRIELYEVRLKITDIRLPDKRFSTGSEGYFASTKPGLNGKMPMPVSNWFR
jgi:hypothetical protein